MSARRLFPHQEDLVEQVLNGDPMPVVLRAPAGAGVDSVLVALCRDAVRSGAEERILSVVATRAQAEQFVALIEDELGAGIAAPITSKTFRFFLDEGDQSARVFVITASLVLRDDVLPALQQIGWSVVIGRGSFDTRYRSTRAILSLAPRRGLLFVDTGSRLAGDPSSPEHRVVDWHALSREQLGLYPEREVLVIEFRRTDEEIAALMRLDEMLRDWPGLVSAWIHRAGGPVPSGERTRMTS